MSDILVVDDEQAIRHLLSEVLAKDGHRVENAPDGDAAIEVLQASDFDLVVSDLHMKDTDGISVLRATKSKNLYTEVLILTGKGTVATAVEAMRLGAYEYLTKPIDLQEFRLKVRQALERRAMRLQIEAQRRELQIHQDMIARDLKLAGQVQLSLVPPPFQHERVEVAVRYKPMIGVGGDFSDLYFDGERQLYLTVVDVTGHGITAALLVNRMANEIRRLLREGLEPRILLHQFNNFICDSFAGTGMFLTMFICKLDLKNFTLTYAGSAHPAAVIWRERQAQFEKLDSQNPIVGFDQAEEERFTQNVTQLAPSDKLLMYTDGIIEAENAAGKALGLRGMLGLVHNEAALSSEQAADRIMTGLSQWTNRPLRDDVYLLVAGMK
ncbi:MAG: SpoIIE family protein phosphatase [candidate division KSB1 bacterium]